MPARAAPMPAPYASARASAFPVASWCTATSAGVPMPCSYVAPNQVPGALRSDHRDVHARRRHDRAEVDVEAVREHQHVAGFEVRLDVLGVHGRCAVSGRSTSRRRPRRTASAVSRTRRPASSAFARLDDPARRPTRTSRPGVAEVQRMRVTLAPEPEDRDLLPLQDARVRILLVVDRRHRASSPSRPSFRASLAQTVVTPPPSRRARAAARGPRALADPRSRARARSVRSARAPRCRNRPAAPAAPRACPANRSPRS